MCLVIYDFAIKFCFLRFIFIFKIDFFPNIYMKKDDNLILIFYIKFVPCLDLLRYIYIDTFLCILTQNRL